MDNFTAPITDFRANLAHYLREVRRGRTLTLTDHHHPVVKIKSVAPQKTQLSNTEFFRQLLATKPKVKTPKDLATNVDKYLYG
jgi:prevent-host-death family protein